MLPDPFLWEPTPVPSWPPPSHDLAVGQTNPVYLTPPFSAGR